MPLAVCNMGQSTWGIVTGIARTSAKRLRGAMRRGAVSRSRPLFSLPGWLIFCAAMGGSDGSLRWARDEDPAMAGDDGRSLSVETASSLIARAVGASIVVAARTRPTPTPGRGPSARKVRVLRDDGEPVLRRVLPHDRVACTVQSDEADVVRVGEEVGEACDEQVREILVEEECHAAG